MKVTLLLCHPKPGSFNHALAETVAEVLHSAGHCVAYHDLYAEGFDPLLTSFELEKEPLLPPLIDRHVTELTEAEGLVVVHPNYWSRPPALLCGWEDRVLRSGRAYRFVPDGKGGARPEGLLKLRFALVLNTANSPQEKELVYLGDPLETHWRKVVCGLCGVPRVERLVFSPVLLSTLEQRTLWLAQARERALNLCFNSGAE